MTYHRSDRRFGTLVVLIAQVSVKVRVWCINTWHTVPPSSTGGAASSRSGRFAGAFTSFSCQSPCKMYKRQLLEDTWLHHVLAVEAIGENGVFSKDCSPQQIIMPCVCVTNTD